MTLLEKQASPSSWAVQLSLVRDIKLERSSCWVFYPRAALVALAHVSKGRDRSLTPCFSSAPLLGQLEVTEKGLGEMKGVLGFWKAQALTLSSTK